MHDSQKSKKWIAPVVILAAVALLIGGVLGFRAWQTRPLGEPQAIEFADATIGDDLTNARILALGEATHGNAELQLLRRDLIAKLPEFGAIAIEEDYGSVAQVNDYIQGGPGTAAEAVTRFGFVLNHTQEMADLLQWIHDHNAGIAAEQRIQLVGIDVQRVEANKQIALDWLADHEPAAADPVREALGGWTDASTEIDPAWASAVGELIEAIEATPEGDDRQVALNAAITLQQHLELEDAPNYAATRAQLMADNLIRTVSEQQARGNDHTLLFAHAGHVDKTSAAYQHKDLGTRLADEYGDDYRAIGTEVHHSRIVTGQREDRWEVTLDHPTPLRGIFADTQIGYLEFADASPRNAEVLSGPVRMASAGENFQQWQAWIPWFNSVVMVPTEAYDALVLVEDAGPVTPL